MKSYFLGTEGLATGHPGHPIAATGLGVLRGGWVFIVYVQPDTPDGQQGDSQWPGLLPAHPC